MKTACRRMNHMGLLIFAIAVLVVVTAFSRQANAVEYIKFACSDPMANATPYKNRCDVAPNAVTIRSDGKEMKGHMVSGYECVNGKCVNHMSGAPAREYNCSLDDLDCFCKLIKPDGCPLPGKWVVAPVLLR